jgi:hypothetical protein
VRPCRRSRPLLALAALAASAFPASACHDHGPDPAPQGYLFEKGPYQGFYDPSGKLIRLLYDQNGDKKADVVMLFYPSGRPRQVEADTDLDGQIDRWQYYSENGVLEKQGYSSHGGKQPDTWEYFDAKGTVVRREVDEGGDGKVDRTETIQDGRVIAVGIDADGDGRIDRWQTWVHGRVTSEEIDTDGDGVTDRRLRYGADGRVIAVEMLPRPAAAGAPPAAAGR